MPQPEAKNGKPLCFVVGPIGEAGSETRKHADMLLHGVIKEVLEGDEFGYLVKRADDDARPGMISDRIIHDIVQAELVVADLTDLNANAFYELGIRHAAQKPTIHIVKSGTKLPFDNSHHDAIFIDVTSWQDIISGRARLAASAKAISLPDYVVSNPITQANATFALKSSSDPKDQLIADLRERLVGIESEIYKRQPKTQKTISSPYVHDDEIDEINLSVAKYFQSGATVPDTVSLLISLADKGGFKLRDVRFDEVTFQYNLADCEVKIDFSGGSIETIAKHRQSYIRIT